MAPRLTKEEKELIIQLGSRKEPLSVLEVQDVVFKKSGRIITDITIYRVYKSAGIEAPNKISRPNWGGYRNGVTNECLEYLHELYAGNVEKISEIVKQQPLNLAKRCSKLGLEVNNVPKSVRQKESDLDYYPLARCFVSLRRG